MPQYELLMPSRYALPETPLFLTLTTQEQKTIRSLYGELPSSYWKRYSALLRKQRCAQLSPEEYIELLALIEKGEDWNVRRLTYLFDLAKHYEQPASDFLDMLELRYHPRARRRI
jgi:hypothetical protein